MQGLGWKQQGPQCERRGLTHPVGASSDGRDHPQGEGREARLSLNELQLWLQTEGLSLSPHSQPSVLSPFSALRTPAPGHSTPGADRPVTLSTNSRV